MKRETKEDVRMWDARFTAVLVRFARCWAFKCVNVFSALLFSSEFCLFE